jgi:3-oxoacyl-[acyl-carrier-protein] synthase II
MSVDVVVTGIGLQCCLGSLNQSWQQILTAKTGIKRQQPFLKLPFYPLGAIAQQPASLTHLTKTILDAAIADAQIETPLPDCGVAIASSRGCQAQLEMLSQQLQEKGRIEASNWLEVLPNHLAIAAAQQIETTAVVIVPTAACATGIWAIAQGVELIRQGACQRVIAGAIETPITPLSLAAFDRMGALATTGCYPFDRQREGLVLGEGGALLVLETAELALKRKVHIYGRILGFGMTCDASHISAPAADNHSASLALKQCLDRSTLSFNDIDFIHAHGTSTKLNDAREAAFIQHWFGDRVAVSSTKGATGHTLGASGALGAAICLLAIEHRCLPPCVGLRELEFAIDVVTKARSQTVRQALCFSFGFGGQNAILALGKF